MRKKHYLPAKYMLKFVYLLPFSNKCTPDVFQNVLFKNNEWATRRLKSVNFARYMLKLLFTSESVNSEDIYLYFDE